MDESIKDKISDKLSNFVKQGGFSRQAVNINTVSKFKNLKVENNIDNNFYKLV